MDESVWENLALSLIEQAEAKALSDKDLVVGLGVVVEVLQTRIEEAQSDMSKEFEDDDDSETTHFEEEESDVKELDFD